MKIKYIKAKFAQGQAYNEMQRLTKEHDYPMYVPIDTIGCITDLRYSLSELRGDIDVSDNETNTVGILIDTDGCSNFSIEEAIKSIKDYIPNAFITIRNIEGK